MFKIIVLVSMFVLVYGIPSLTPTNDAPIIISEVIPIETSVTPVLGIKDILLVGAESGQEYQRVARGSHHRSSSRYGGGYFYAEYGYNHGRSHHSDDDHGYRRHGYGRDDD